MSELEIPERAWEVTDRVCCCRAHSGVAASAPIIVAAYIRDVLMPDAADLGDGTDAWLELHARGLDPNGAVRRPNDA